MEIIVKLQEELTQKCMMLSFTVSTVRSVRAVTSAVDG